MSTQTPDRPDSLTDSIVIHAEPMRVWDVVSDVTRTGEWSPVCKACWWIDDDTGATGPQVGAWFGGRQETADRTWETTSQVTESEPGVAFAWQVGGNLIRWGYRLRSIDAASTELTETWELNDATKQMFAEKYADRGAEVLDQRRQEAMDGIPVTLARIKEIVEREA